MFNNCPVNVVSVELVLINIYYKLCNPTFLDEWKELYKKENNLIKLIKKGNYVKTSLNVSDKIINEIVKYSKLKNLILIGVNALLLYMFKFDKPKYKNKLIFISENMLENDANNLTPLLEKYGDFVFEYEYINLPFDIRIRKLVIIHNEERIAEIYNIGEFELVPYNIINDIKVGSPPLIMRFSLIELYINKLNKSLLYNTLSFNTFIKEKSDLATYFPVTYIGRYENYEKLKTIFGEMLRDIQRITSEGDFEAARKLVETYGVKVDVELHKEVLKRFEKLHIAPYKGFINPVLVPSFENGKFIDVKVEYPDDFTKQMLFYAKHYSFLPSIN